MRRTARMVTLMVMAVVAVPAMSRNTLKPIEG